MEQQLYYAFEPVYDPGPPTSRDYHKFQGTSTPIVIDNGASQIRAGWAGESDPRLSVDNVVSKYKDRKTNLPINLAGAQVYADTTSKLNVKYPYEGDIVCAFDAMEVVLDYTFGKLGIQDVPAVEHPIAMTETLCNPAYSRSLMSELLFEGYNVPSVSYHSDALSSFYATGQKDGLIISSGASSTTVIPVLDGQARLDLTKRLLWGGTAAADYLLKLLQLKYPAFPVKVTFHQASDILKEHGYLSRDYIAELAKSQNPTEMVNHERIIQFPFTEIVAEEKTAEEQELLTEKRREQMHRLQETAAKQRMEKLVQKEQDLATFTAIKACKATDKKADYIKRIEAEGFLDEAELDDAIKKTQKSLQKARNKDLGIEDEEKAPPVFHLIDTPDDQLTEEEIKEKRRQKLIKAGYDARMRAKEEKEAEKKRLEEEARAEAEFQKNNPEAWLARTRQQHEDILLRLKERQKRRAQLTDRKSLAAQNRMKTIATMASDMPAGKKKRKKNAEDTFGANDADWAVYREIGGDDDDDDEDDLELLRKVESQLLEHDPTFSLDDTAERQAMRKMQLLNAFHKGIAPGQPLSSYDATDPAQLARIHLNVERIRVPEALYQPQMAGIDQAGLLEVIGHVLKQFTPLEQARLLSNVFVTGGHTLTRNFDARLSSGLTCILPVDTPFHIKRAKDARLQAWQGLAKFASTDAYRSSVFTRQEYTEYGAEYLKENALYPVWSV